MKKLITFLVILLTVIYILGPVIDSDLWWHIVIGRWILNHGFCHQDYWNLYSEGVFRAYSWLPEIVFAFIDKYIGVFGFLYLKVVLGTILGISLVNIYQKTSKDDLVGAIFGLITLLSFCEFFTLRPQIISWICFIFSVYFANEIFTKGWNKLKYIQVFLLFSLWTNSHITQVLGMFAFFLWGFNGFNKNTYKLFLVPFLGTLLNPYFISVWVTFFTKVDHPFMYGFIAEFRPFSVLIFVSAVFINLLCFFCMLWHFYSDALTKTRILSLFIFIIASLFVVKMAPYAIMLLSFSICILWSKDFAKKVWNINEAFERLKKVLLYFEGTGSAFLLLCLIIVNNKILINKEIQKDRTANIPIQAVNFIKKNNLKFPLLNNFSSGGYLIYSFSNEKGEAIEKFPIDGRTNVNSKKVSKMFVKAFSADKGWQKYINFVNPNTILWPNSSPLVRVLNEKKDDWCRVYADKYAQGFTVFIKRGLNDSLCLN